MMKTSDTVLVTGAAGLVGSAVVSHLRDEGFHNIVPVNRHVCDLRDLEATLKLFRSVGPDHVFHAAACVFGIGGNMANQGRSFLENTLINTSVIDATRRVGAQKITVMGTNAIYPWPPAVPLKESGIFNGRPHSSESAYGHAKRGMLAMLEAYSDSYGLDWSYLVSGNLYGPGDKFDPVNGHVLPTMVYKFYNAYCRPKENVELWGDGSPIRDFLYVKDLARLVRMAMDQEHGIMNIGDGRTHSILEVAEKLSAISGVSMSRVKFDRSKPNGRQNCAIDLSRLRKTGFHPQFSLEAGLRETWEAYQWSIWRQTGQV